MNLTRRTLADQLRMLARPAPALLESAAPARLDPVISQLFARDTLLLAADALDMGAELERQLRGALTLALPAIERDTNSARRLCLPRTISGEALLAFAADLVNWPNLDMLRLTELRADPHARCARVIHGLLEAIEDSTDPLTGAGSSAAIEEAAAHLETLQAFRPLDPPAEAEST